MIQVKDLTKYYGETRALHNVSFEVKKGEVLGFLGPNGAGKTTAMKILTGFMPGDSGEVKIDNTDIYMHPIQTRRKIGYLPENAPLYNELNVLEYLQFVAQMHDIPKKKQNKKIKEIVEVCGLKNKLRSEIGELSKGYRQRVGLAQTMIHSPEILILDEPTSGLDPNQIIEIREMIKKIGKQKTVILSTHILSEVEATCSRVLIINEGEIVAKGTPKELRDMAAGHTKINLKVEGPAKTISEKLMKLPKIENVITLKSSEPGVANLDIEVEKGVDLRKEINEFLMKNNYPLLEMKQEEMSLENIFTHLTKK